MLLFLLKFKIFSRVLFVFHTVFSYVFLYVFVCLFGYKHRPRTYELNHTICSESLKEVSETVIPVAVEREGSLGLP